MRILSAADTFTYTISDGNGGTDTATVTVTVLNADTDFFGTAGDDTFYVKLDATGTIIEVYANDSGTGTPIFTTPLASTTDLSFDMLAGDDRLFVDLANGSPLPTGGIDLVGGANRATGDRLLVLGDDLATGSYNASAATTGDGVVTLNGRQIDLTGVEPIHVSDLLSFSVTTPNADDTLTVTGTGSGIDTLVGTSGAVTLSPVVFSNIGTLVIDAAVNDAGAGNDSLSISSTGQVPASLGFIQYRTGTGANTLDIQDGTARVDATMATGGTLDTTVDDGAELFTHRFRQTSLSIGNGSVATVVPLTGSEVSVLDSLTIAGIPDAWTGRLDLNTSDLIVQSTAAEKAGEFATLYNQLRQGFNGGAWLGNGINSLAAATNANIDTGLALVDNGVFGFPTFSGQPVDDNSLLIKYTYYGDIDLNGQVDADDLTVFANNFGRRQAQRRSMATSTSTATWTPTT